LRPYDTRPYEQAVRKYWQLSCMNQFINHQRGISAAASGTLLS